jgi:pyridoxal phosphate enzyme (YggS family)
VSDDIAGRVASIRARIAAAVADRGPGAEVTLVAVSKRQSTEAIRAAYAAGVRDFGENFAQELDRKRRELADLADLRWHFIGAVQRNKAPLLAGCFLVHTVDRPAVIDALARRATGLRECLVEVNFGEPQKAGVAPADLPALLDAFGGNPLRCVGLMALPPEGPPEATRRWFAQLRNLRDGQASVARAGVDLRHLSMGMSADFEIAIAQGATIVRVGTALFGERT